MYESFDIVIVPFPFVDCTDQIKRRPAMILSSLKNFNAKSGHSVMVMITSARNQPWSLDVAISDYESSGLLNASVLRMKIFTLDNRLILGKIGKLAPKDQQVFLKTVKTLFPNFF
ncbi:MAG: type II toxin-antitoxin system PemK/MazF family toxin [bacterium]